VKKIGKNSKK